MKEGTPGFLLDTPWSELLPLILSRGWEYIFRERSSSTLENPLPGDVLEFVGERSYVGIELLFSRSVPGILESVLITDPLGEYDSIELRLGAMSVWPSPMDAVDMLISFDSPGSKWPQLGFRPTEQPRAEQPAPTLPKRFPRPRDGQE